MEHPSPKDTEFRQLDFEDLVKMVLRKEQFSMRPTAMRALAERAKADTNCLSLLARSLKEMDPSSRRRATQTLGLCGEAAHFLLPELCQLVQSDTIWTVREAGVRAIHSLCWPATNFDFLDGIELQLVEWTLRDREPLVREACVQALETCLKDPKVSEGVKVAIWKELKTGMEHSHASRRFRAVSALCALADQNSAVVSCITGGLRDSHWKVRRTTVQQLGNHPELVFSESGFRSLLPELIKKRFDGNLVVKNAVIEVLHRLEINCEDKELGSLLYRLRMPPSPWAVLSVVFSEFPLSGTGANELRSICLRRLKWHAEKFNTTQAIAVDESLPLGELIALVVNQAETIGTQTHFKETVWLLARWVECYFVTNLNC